MPDDQVGREVSRPRQAGSLTHPRACRRGVAGTLCRRGHPATHSGLRVVIDRASPSAVTSGVTAGERPAAQSGARSPPAGPRSIRRRVVQHVEPCRETSIGSAGTGRGIKPLTRTWSVALRTPRIALMKRSGGRHAAGTGRLPLRFARARVRKGVEELLEGHGGHESDAGRRHAVMDPGGCDPRRLPSAS